MAVTQIRRTTQIKPTGAYKWVTNDSSGNIQDTTVTASKAVASDANGLPVAATTTAAELDFLAGVTSSVQTQLNGKASTALSNLASVAINTALLATSDNTIDLGSDAKEWANLWAFNIKHNDSGTPNLVIATTGNNGNISLSPHGNGFVDLNNKVISNLADPVANQDAATKFYVDSMSAGLDPKASVRVATTSAGGNIAGYSTPTLTVVVDSNTNYFPTDGSGIKVDGIFLAVNDRVLVKNQTDAKQNGIYKVTAIGNRNDAGSDTNAVLTRSADMDGTPANEVSGGNFTFVEVGTQSGTGWVVVFDGTITLNTDNVDWTQFSDTGDIQAGAGLTRTGNTIDVVSSNTAITVNANDIALTLATNSGLTISSGLKILSDTVTANTIGINLTANGSSIKFDSASFADGGSETLALAAGVAGSGLALTTGVLSVNVDGSTIEINSDTLRVKAAGITANELASNSVTFAKTYQVVREVPSGTVNGSNTTFTPANLFVNGSEMVFLNGILQNSGGNDYTGNGTTIVFTSAPLTGDVVLVSYWKA